MNFKFIITILCSIYSIGWIIAKTVKTLSLKGEALAEALDYTSPSFGFVLVLVCFLALFFVHRDRFADIIKWIFLVPASLLGLALLLIFPFIVLIKSAVFSYSFGLSTFSSLAIGSVATFVVLLVYLLVIDRVTRRKFILSIKAKLIVASLVVVMFNGYALFVLSDQNVKNKSIANEYQDLHPILRIGIRTWSLFDPSLVITDMSRSLKDYKKMRVRAYKRSLHFTQKDGFVHAVDLRTKRRSKFSNWMTQTMFKMMGFGTLRHVGSADHLHVELVISKKASLAHNRIARSRLAKKRRTKRRKVKKKVAKKNKTTNYPYKHTLSKSADSSRSVSQNQSPQLTSKKLNLNQSLSSSTRPKKKLKSSEMNQTPVKDISTTVDKSDGLKSTL